MTVSAELAQAWWDELERLSGVLGRVGLDEICCAGLTQRQCAILKILVEREGARLSDLAVHSRISPSAMSRILDKLEQRKLIKRVWGKGSDGRAATVVITAAGRKTRHQLDRLMLQRSAQLAAALPAAQRAAILEALRTLNNVLENTSCCALNEPVAVLPINGDES
jgi:DNA-binding MarR family transcriptional regulator